jgi:hypothetical protein
VLEGSAITAMAALRTLVEERLMQTEDYRALKALDKAIADLRAPHVKNTSKPEVPDTPVAAQQAQLQQKLVEKYNSSAA